MDTISVKENGEQAVVKLAGRIDSNNAPAVEEQIIAGCAGKSDIIIDAEELKYISSAGLRVMLRLRKTNPNLKIINVCSEVYEVFEVTGFSEIIKIEKAYRRVSVEGCKVIGKGAKGTVYRLDQDTIIKAYHNSESLPQIQRERELARKAFVLGIPTAIPYDVVKVGESFGSVFELLSAQSYSELIKEHPENIAQYAADCANLLRQIHETPVKPDDMPDIKTLVMKWFADVKEWLPEQDFEKLKTLISAVEDTNNMLHGDYHTNNIMMQNGETLLIDMDTLAHGHPIFELANTYIAHVGFGQIDKTIVEDFIGVPFELSSAFWDAFLPLYLNTSDGEQICQVREKIELVAQLRILRHTVRRKVETEYEKKVVDFSRQKISSLLSKVSTLEF